MEHLEEVIIDPPVEEVKKKRGGGRPKGSKNKKTLEREAAEQRPEPDKVTETIAEIVAPDLAVDANSGTGMATADDTKAALEIKTKTQEAEIAGLVQEMSKAELTENERYRLNEEANKKRKIRAAERLNKDKHTWWRGKR